MPDRIRRKFGKIRFDMFLDRSAVTNAVDKKTRRVLARTGGFARKDIRQNMRKGGKPPRLNAKGKQVGGKAHTSKPGQPPRWHTRKLKDQIFFFYDMKAKEVVIGPRPFKSTPSVTPHAASGAQLLNEGGSFGYRSWKSGKKSRRTMRARPFIAPSLPKAIAKFKEELAAQPLL